jgi:serine/threonine-protein kinase
VIAGKYRLTRVIGRGGMGSVWLAHNIPLDIDVAIKLIRRDRTAPEAPGRLLQEARAAARLHHPSIVRVFDFGESEQGDPFIVMELLHGEPLSAILRRKRRLSATVAVQTLLPVASALCSAHAKGIVHRDLKPDNILLSADETGSIIPKVVDFGIAKLLLSSDPDRQFTMAGEVLGSPDYMSPEQARGSEQVGEPTDIWALSVVLYEAIAGRRPFDGPNYNSLIAAILTADPVPITELGAGDAALWAILDKGLTKDTRQRWSTMKELGAALATWAVEQGLDDDLTGAPIAKAWLSGAAKRLLTVYPDSQPSSSGVRPAAGLPAVPAAPPVPRSAPVGEAAPREPVITPPTRRPPKQSSAAIIALFTAAAALILLSAVAYLAREPLARLIQHAEPEGSAALPAPASAGALAALPPSSEPPPSAAPTASVAAPQPSASAPIAPQAGTASSPVVASGSGKLPLGKAPPTKKKAPPVPTKIVF